MRPSARVALAALTVLALAGLAGCHKANHEGTQPAPAGAAREVGSGTLVAGDPVAAPKGKVVLTLSGAIGTHDRGRTLALDIASLRRMHTVELVVRDPFLKRRATFTGVPVSDLLAVAKVSGSATGVHMTALDDYQVDFKLRDVKASRMLLATRLDGKPMPINNMGPIRIVFPDGSALATNSDMWIFSVSRMRLG
jgi:hypothetical protein